MNLALGTLYAWSVFVAPLEDRFGWKRADTSMVFTIAVIVFAVSFVVAGRIQDKFGPVSVLVGGRNPGEPWILPVLLHHESQLPLSLFRGDRRAWERVRVRHAHSGYGQMVS